MDVRSCGWKYLTLRELDIKSYVKPFLVAKAHPTNTPQQPFVTSTMVENIEYDTRGATWPGELDPMANMMISPFFKSAADIGKKGHRWLAEFSHFC